MPTTPVPTPTDGTVTLRAHHEAHIEACYEQCQDPRSQDWTSVTVPYHPRTFVTEVVTS